MLILIGKATAAYNSKIFFVNNDTGTNTIWSGYEVTYDQSAGWP